MKYLVHAIIMLLFADNLLFSMNTNITNSSSKRHEYYPSEQQEKPYADIYFKNSKHQFQHAINQFNQSQQKTQKKIYDSQNNLIKIIQYQYDKNGNLEKEIHQSKEGKNTIEILYDGPSPLFKKKIIKEEDTKLYIEYQYLYDKKERLSQSIETIFDLEDRSDPNHYLQINITSYRYPKSNIKIIEEYTKSTNPNNYDFTSKDTQAHFQSAEIYEYIYPNKLNRLFQLNQQKMITRCLIYDYDENYQLRKVSVFVPKKSINWNNFSMNHLGLHFTLSYYVLYANNIQTMNTILKRNKVSESIQEKSFKSSNLKEQDDTLPKNIIFKNKKKN